MKKILRRLTASVLAAASIGIMSATASAETILKPPVDWIAVRAQGAPSNVNKTYYYPIYIYGNGYDITCTFFLGDYDREVVVRNQYKVNVLGIVSPVDEEVEKLHSTTYSPILVENPSGIYGNSITFSFAAKCFNNCNAGGVISYHG